MTRVANDGGRRGPVLPSGRAPGLPLESVLELEVLAGATVIAGRAGLRRVVSRVNVMEVPDVLPYVRVGELLLTTGYAVRKHPERLADLVRELHARDVAALGIKLGRYVDELPAAVLEVADELGFPVVRLPDLASYDELLTQVLTAVLDHQAERLTRSDDAHRALVEVVLDGGGLAEVAAALARILSAVVLVAGVDDQLVAAAGDDDELARARESLVDASGRVGAGAGTAVVRVLAGAQDHGRIVAFSTQRVLGDLDVQALERAATVCALAIAKQQAVSAVETRYQADFLRDLLLGRAGGRERTVPHARGLGWQLDRPVVVVVVRPDPVAGGGSGAGAAVLAGAGADTGAGVPGVDGGSAMLAGGGAAVFAGGGADAGGAGFGDQASRAWLERLTSAWASAVRLRDPGAAVVGFGTEVVAVIGVPTHGDVDRLVAELAASVRSDAGRRTFSVGSSSVAGGVDQVPAAYEQAATAVRVGRQVHGVASVASFDRLGLHRLLSLVPETADLVSFERSTLRGLAADTPDAADLRHTLQVLLDTNLNVAQTARALHFHYNTLRYRIAKLERILGPFTHDPVLRLDLAVALRVVQMRGIPR